MKERPILFSAPMVRAILAGDKTQTRRLMKVPCQEICERDDGRLWPWSEHPDKADDHWHSCPHGLLGDRLYVRETWGYRSSSTIGKGDHYVWGHMIEYAADNARRTIESPESDQVGLPRQRQPREGEDRLAYENYLTSYWRANRPSIHMPRWACRSLLDITAVRIERLQDISAEDAIAEGLSCITLADKTRKYGIPDRDGAPGAEDGGWHLHEWERDPIAAFAKLWSKTYGTSSWDANPWVWAIDFRRVVNGASC